MFQGTVVLYCQVWTENYAVTSYCGTTVFYLSISYVFLGIQSQIVVMVTSDTARDISY